jgi:hypothetical protein
MSDWMDEARLQAAKAFLRQGLYREGLELFEARPSQRSGPIAKLGAPEWDGGPLDGKVIAVWGEGGLGDEICMVRFVPHLRRRGARAVLIGCLPPLVSLFQPWADAAYPRTGEFMMPRFDAWISMLSLPHRLGVTPERLSGAPYIRVAETPYVGGVGLVWRGNPVNPRDVHRSMASSDLLASVPGGVFLEPRGDVADSARQLAGLDALITVDTSWAHLAGAMGLACAVLLDASEADWRWGLGETTPWYDSVRIFRQRTPGEWAEPVAAASAYVAGFSGGSRSTPSPP